MNFKKIKLELQRKTENELKRYQFVGAEIKNCRLKLSKTLDSISNVNKSISYISKIENNRIVPNQSSLMELCNELLISSDDLESMSNFDDTLVMVLEAIYRKNSQVIELAFQQYSCFTNVRTQLMRGLYYFYNEDYRKLEETVEQLGKIEGCLNVDDYLIYVLISVKMLIHNNEMLQAYKVINVIEQERVGIKEVLRLFSEIKHEIKLNFGLSMCTSDFEELLSMHAHYVNFERSKEVVRNFKEKQIELSDIDSLDSIIKNIDNNELLCFAYCKKGDMLSAKKHFNLDLNAKFVAYYYFKNENVEELENMLSSENVMSEYLLIMCNYYVLLLKNDEVVLRDYLVDTCIPYFLKNCRINVLLEMYQILSNINTKISKYKETCIASLKITKLIEELTNSIL